MGLLRAESLNKFKGWVSVELVRPLLEPILHPSRWRIRALAISTAIGHPLFYFIWGRWIPQPYENLSLRLTMAALGLCLMIFTSITATPPSPRAAVVFSVIFWITLPLFFCWMYLCNRGNTVWLASMTAMFLIYYHLTDWRLATLGTFSGLLVAWVLFEVAGPWSFHPDATTALTQAVVLGFGWYMALVLGISTSSLRREQLNTTLATMGIMAHELRTPLATMALLGDALNNSAHELDEQRSAQLKKLSDRLHALVGNMNRQIDMQIANARMLRLPVGKERVVASELLLDVTSRYPYRSPRERTSVQVQVHQDFAFEGSRQLFSQVIENLMRNALRSLAAATGASQPGDLLLEAGVVGNRGRLVVTDRGIGIDREVQPQIFEPFFSTDHGTGHGLGLAFTQRVVKAARGSIRVKSTRLKGARFTIELPVTA